MVINLCYLEREFSELSEVVPGQLALSVVVGQGHGGHLARLGGRRQQIPGGP